LNLSKEKKIIDMRTINSTGLLLLFILFAFIALPFQSCEKDTDNCDDECDSCNYCDTCIVVYKPNLYIYPLSNIYLSVNLNFPLGGGIINSIPSYGGDGWEIFVDTTGMINNTYSFLFYESTQPDVWQENEGWVVDQSDLPEFFESNMSVYGFSNNEIQDFNEYWIPRLIEHSYYLIYPQTKELINTVIELGFSEEPDNLLRLFYLIKGYDNHNIIVTEPEIAPFNRNGFIAAEWGVILK
jgi:hypothetical protein